MKNLSLKLVLPPAPPPTNAVDLHVTLSIREMMALRNLLGHTTGRLLDALYHELCAGAKSVGHGDYLDYSCDDQRKWEEEFAHKYTHPYNA